MKVYIVLKYNDTGCRVEKVFGDRVIAMSFVNGKNSKKTKKQLSSCSHHLITKTVHGSVLFKARELLVKNINSGKFIKVF